MGAPSWWVWLPGLCAEAGNGCVSGWAGCDAWWMWVARVLAATPNSCGKGGRSRPSPIWRSLVPRPVRMALWSLATWKPGGSRTILLLRRPGETSATSRRWIKGTVMHAIAAGSARMWPRPDSIKAPSSARACTGGDGLRPDLDSSCHCDHHAEISRRRAAKCVAIPDAQFCRACRKARAEQGLVRPEGNP